MHSYRAVAAGGYRILHRSALQLPVAGAGGIKHKDAEADGLASIRFPWCGGGLSSVLQYFSSRRLWLSVVSGEKTLLTCPWGGKLVLSLP